MPNLKTIACPHCGEKFKQNHGRQKYCNLKCTKAANARASKDKKKEEKKIITSSKQPENRASRGEYYEPFVKIMQKKF